MVLGLAYPALVFGVGRAVAPAQGDGFFYPRHSAVDWDPASSSASNLGPNQPALVQAIEANRAEVAGRENVAPEAVPVDAVTASGSGLDPHISTAYAELQLPRLAAAHGFTEAELRELMAGHSISGVNAFLGQESVNTSTLNAALDAVQKSAAGLQE